MNISHPKFSWDGPNRTLYVQVKSKPSDMAGRITQYRKRLATTPDDLRTRLYLANCLYGIGQREEAELEWDKVVASGDTELIPEVAQIRQALCSQSEPPAA